MKSPARVPRPQVPVVLMAPEGASGLTPLGEDDRPRAVSPGDAINAAAPAAARLRPRAASSPLRSSSLQRERVQLAAHLGLERVIDDLVLLHPGFAAEGFREDGRGVMVAITGEIANRHFRI